MVWLFPKWKQPLFHIILRFQKYFLDVLRWQARKREQTFIRFSIFENISKKCKVWRLCAAELWLPNRSIIHKVNQPKQIFLNKKNYKPLTEKVGRLLLNFPFSRTFQKKRKVWRLCAAGKHNSYIYFTLFFYILPFILTFVTLQYQKLTVMDIAEQI